MKLIPHSAFERIPKQYIHHTHPIPLGEHPRSRIDILIQRLVLDIPILGFRVGDTLDGGEDVGWADGEGAEVGEAVSVVRETCRRRGGGGGVDGEAE